METASDGPDIKKRWGSGDCRRQVWGQRRKISNQQSLQRNRRARNKREEIKAVESLGTAKGNKKGVLQIYQGKEILQSCLAH